MTKTILNIEFWKIVFYPYGQVLIFGACHL